MASAVQLYEALAMAPDDKTRAASRRPLSVGKSTILPSLTLYYPCLSARNRVSSAQRDRTGPFGPQGRDQAAPLRVQNRNRAVPLGNQSRDWATPLRNRTGPLGAQERDREYQAGFDQVDRADDVRL